MIKTNIDLAKAAINCAKNYKTLYVNGCFGAPMNEANKKTYSNYLSFNKKPERVEKIMNASYDTFGFDCICFIKGLLWGWNGDYTKQYGGAIYQSNGVPDINEYSMLQVCNDKSNDFSNIEPGEYLWIEGHAGLYVGDGLAVECTHRWNDGVQFTACNQDINGYNRRDWTYHGKLPYITYKQNKYTQEDFIKDVQKILEKPQTGIADAELIKSTITISENINNMHPLVIPIQKWLYALGYTQIGEADGEAGPKFTMAVSAYQKDNGNTSDGEITAQGNTWKKLLNYINNEAPIIPEEPKIEKEPVSQKPIIENIIEWKVGDCAKILANAKFIGNKPILSWIINQKVYILQLRENNSAIISTQKSGPIAGAVYLKDLVPYNDDVYDVIITANLLNVRLSDSPTAKIINQIKKDTKHTIIEEKNGWGHIANSGWINLKYTEKV